MPIGGRAWSQQLVKLTKLATAESRASVWAKYASSR